MIVNTWHHLPRREEHAKRLRRSLRADGELLIVDFSQTAPLGPPPEFRLRALQVVEELEADEAFLAEVISVALPHQYAVRAQPLTVYPY